MERTERDRDFRGVLTQTDICKIIETCKACNVNEFTCGDLKVIFATNPLVANAFPIDNQISMDEKSEDLIAAQSMDQLEQDSKEMDMSELLISDPAEYERLLAMGELKDAE